MRSSWLKLLVLLLALSLVLSCGGGGGGGGGTPGVGSDPAAIVPGSGSGSKTTPIALALGTTTAGSIGLGGVSYYSFSAPATGPYTVALTGATSSVIWSLYANSAFTGSVDSCGFTTATTTCYVSLTGGTTYYIMVNNLSFSSGTYYNITITSGGGNEGTIGAPVPLTVGTPHNATIDNNGKGYYTFTANQSGSFIISLTNTHKDLEWSLYTSLTDTSYTSIVVSLCNKTSAGVNETCSTPNLTSGQPYYLIVHNNDYADDTFTVTVSNGASEGSTAGPVDLVVGTTHVGGVDSSVSSSGTSYYRFTTDASSTSSYNIVVSNVTPTANLSLAVYSDAAFSTAITSCYASNQCTLSGAAASTGYYVRIWNAVNSPSRTYTVLVTSGGSEGSPAGPVALTVGQARNAGVDGSTSSYYVFTTANNGVGGSHTISLANTQTNLGWTLYTDAAFTQSLADGACDVVTTAGPGDESCSTTNLDPNTTYYLKVSNGEATAGAYAVTVAAGGWSEGSKNYPLTVGALHNGSVIRYGRSYYKFTTGNSAQTYVISLTNMQTNLSWRLYTDPTSAFDILSCTQGSGAADEVCSTTSTVERVLAANTAYYLNVENNVSGNTNSTYSLKIEPLDPAAGCSASAAECFSFQDGIMPLAYVLTQPKNPDKWFIDPANNGGAASGTGSSMRSGAILGGETNCVAYTRMGTNEVLFSLKTETAAAFNYLMFYIDNNSVGYGSWSGTNAWRRVVYTIPSLVGTSHTYKWCYEKGTASTGADAVWVDDIEFR